LLSYETSYRHRLGCRLMGDSVSIDLGIVL
jgi:hypothetical protein